MSQLSLVEEVNKATKTNNMKDQYIGDLKVNDKVTNFLVVVKSIRKGKTSQGKDFMDLVIGDKTGDLIAKIWADGLDNCDKCEIGDIVSITAQVGEFRNQPQAVITFLQRTNDYEISDFLKTSTKDIDKIYNEIIDEVSSFKNKPLQKLINVFYKDKNFSEIVKQAPAAEKIHHEYIGGFLEHVNEMLDIARTTFKHYENIDFELLAAGVLLHDIGKTKELTVKHTVCRTVEGYLLGHLSIGMLMVNEEIAKIKDFPEDTRVKLLHLIASHHGKLEFGSPVLPMTREAYALCHIDDLSTKLNIANRIITDNQDSEQDFSDRYFALDTKLYLK